MTCGTTEVETQEVDGFVVEGVSSEMCVVAELL